MRALVYVAITAGAAVLSKWAFEAGKALDSDSAFDHTRSFEPGDQLYPAGNQ